MGLFFLISGLVTPNSISRKGPRTFARDRLIRLGVPLVVWTLVIWPGAIWAQVATQGIGSAAAPSTREEFPCAASAST
jgi:fucose 4-O-acetylase-like acetyltransferase